MDLCCDLHRIPAFFDHYQVHKVEYGDTFWEFVEGHYLYNDGDYEFVAEDPDHANLPFRESHNTINQWVFYPNTTAFELDKPIELNAAMLGRYHEHLPVIEAPSPFQPPRVS